MNDAAIPSDLRFLSFVVPVYGSPDSLQQLAARIAAVVDTLGVRHELILVDDRCPLGSWERIRTMSAEEPAVVGVRLSRNFGQHAAIHAGLARVEGDWVVVMDCDLQDQPEEVVRLLAAAAEGYDVVRARRSERNDAWHRRMLSKLFYILLSYLTETRQSAEVANFGVYRRKVIDNINRWQEDSKYFPAIVQWIGFSQKDIDVVHSVRHAGQSSYTFMKLLRLATKVALGFSDRPLRLLVGLGTILVVLAVVVAAATLVAQLTGIVTVEGWSSLMLSIWFLGGAMLASLGLTGLYIGRILVEAKGRPTYVIDELIGDVRPGTTAVDKRA